MTHTPAYLATLAAFFCAAASAQYAYPAKGQSPQQQKTDESACQQWATQQTGFDPSKPPPAAAGPATTATGTTPGAGMRGAAKGAAIAGIADGDAGKGAAVGAVAQRSQSRRANAAAGQQQQAASGQEQANFAKARTACLEGKGYTVK